jgi:hypothetical protein
MFFYFIEIIKCVVLPGAQIRTPPCVLIRGWYAPMLQRSIDEPAHYVQHEVRIIIRMALP